MNLDRVDKLVAVCFAATAAATAAMFFDIWYVVYYAIPILVTLFMLIGSLNLRHEWNTAAVAWILAFGGVLTLLFAAGNASLPGGAILGGLPVSTAVFFYAIWPFTTVVGPLLFVLVYQKWLRHDLEKAEPDPAGSDPVKPDPSGSAGPTGPTGPTDPA